MPSVDRGLQEQHRARRLKVLSPTRPLLSAGEAKVKYSNLSKEGAQSKRWRHWELPCYEAGEGPPSSQWPPEVRSSRLRWLGGQAA